MQHYLFDFDGTLVDSMPTYAGVMLRILEENQIPYPENIIKIITPLGIPGTAQYFMDMGLKRPKEEIMDLMISYMVEEYTHRVPAKENVVEVLRQMKARGDGLHVLTASPHDTLDPCLKRLGIFDLFDNVWSCNDFGTTKADPAIYRMAAEKIGVPVAEVIFLDDNFNADKTAKAAGMRVYGVYDDSSAEYAEEIKAITDRYIYNFTELL
ncbi:MAG: HAD family phosphatase [Ruminococcaceae bacterium]|nr:HAD family phosphatase [Oscillospiraceae bacterium]